MVLCKPAGRSVCVFVCMYVCVVYVCVCVCVYVCVYVSLSKGDLLWRVAIMWIDACCASNGERKWCSKIGIRQSTWNGEGMCGV